MKTRPKFLAWLVLGGAFLALTNGRAAEPAAPVAWGEAAEGLRLGLRAELGAASGAALPAWTVLYQNAGKEPLLVSAAGRTHPIITVNATVVPPGLNRSAAPAEFILMLGGPVWPDEKQRDLQLQPGQTIELPLKSLDSWDPRSLNPREESERLKTPPVWKPLLTLAACAVIEDVEDTEKVPGWHGRVASGKINLRRTKQGWALSHGAEDGKELARDDWATPEQVWEGFSRRKPEFVASLRSKDGNERDEAVAALALLGPDAREAVPALAKLLDEEDPYEGRPLRQALAEALGGMGPAVPEVVPLLAKMLSDQSEANQAVRLAATSALGRLAPTAARQAALIQALKDAWGAVRCEAALQLGKTGPAAQDALPALRDAAKDPLGVVHEAALDAIARITGKPRDEAP